MIDLDNITAIVGIDPGTNGGIATYIRGKNPNAIKMPKDLQGIRDYLEYLKEVAFPLVFLEKLSVRPDDVDVSGGGVNMGKLYRIQRMMAGYEQLKATISLTGVPFVMVHPMKWQNGLKLRQKGEDKQTRKNRFKDVSGELYPGIKPTLWSADAVLIMHFGRVMLANDKKWIMNNLPNNVTRLL